MKNRFLLSLKKYPLVYVGGFLALVVVFGLIVHPALAQTTGDPATPGAIGIFNASLGTIVKAIFSVVALLLMSLASTIGNLCIEIINLIILPGQNSLLFSSQIQEVWGMMLDLANLIFFVSLLGFSIMIITQSGGYNLKKALTGLITTVALANLSYRLVLVMVAVGDSLRNLASSMLGVNAGEFTATLHQFTTLWDTSLILNPDADTFKYILTATMMTAMSLIIMFVLFRLMFILLERAIRIVILTIFGPLQIALGILPVKEVQSLAGNWFGEVTKWVLVLPVTFIILAVGQKLAPSDSITQLQQFIVNGVASPTSYTGSIFFALISLGVMFAATQTPELLKLSLAAGTKALTDFADKTVLGSIQKGAVTGISSGLAYRAKDAKNWATQNLNIKDKNGKVLFGAQTLAGMPKALQARLAGSHGVEEKFANESARELLMKPVLRRLQKYTEVDPRTGTDEESLKFQTLEKELQAIVNDPARGMADPRAMEIRDLQTDIWQKRNSRGKDELLRDPAFAAQIKAADLNQRDTSSKEARINRGPDDLLKQDLKVGEALLNGQIPTLKNAWEGHGYIYQAAGTAGGAKRAEAMEARLEIEKNPENRAKFYEANKFFDWDNFKYPNMVNEALKAVKTSRSASTARNDDIEEDDTAHSNPIAHGSAIPHTDTVVPVTATRTEALLTTAKAEREADDIHKFATNSGITESELEAEISNTGSLSDKVGKMFDGLDDDVKKALLPQLQSLVGEVNGFGHLEAASLANTMKDSASRDAFLRGTTDLKTEGVTASDDLIAKARELVSDQAYKNADVAGQRVMARDKLGADLTPDAVNTLASVLSAKQLDAMGQIATARDAAANPSAMDAALTQFQNTVTKDAWSAAEQRVDTARTQSGNITHPEREAITASVANLNPADLGQAQAIAKTLAKQIADAITATSNPNQQMDLAQTSIDKLGDRFGQEFKSSLTDLNKLMGLNQDNPQARIGGQDQSLAQLHADFTQLLNMTKRGQDQTRRNNP